MSVDLSDAPEQREAGATIPDGTFVKLIMNIRAGGVSLDNMDAGDNGLFIASKSSDAVGLDAEFTVLAGPHAHRKLFSWMTVSGGALDDKGASKGWNMTKATLRAMIDSAMGLDPKDDSAAAKQARRAQGFFQFSGIEFWAKIGVEPGNEIMQQGQGTGRFFDPKNVIERIVVKGDPEYDDLRAGKEVAPKPKHAATIPPVSGHGSAPASSATKPAWGGGGAAAGTAAPANAPPPNQPAAQQQPAPAGPAWLRG